MSKMNYQFMFLSGAVLFSLSALPGIHKMEKVYSTDLLSSSCELEEQLKNGDEAICDVVIKGRRATAIFTKSDKNPDKINMRTEVECRVGCEEGKREVSVRNDLSKNVALLKNIANSTLDADAKKVEAEEAEAKKKEVADKELNRLKDLCIKNEAGENYETQAEVLDCRVGKLQGKDDAERKKYYNAHIRNQLKTLITSTSYPDRSAAREIVNKLGTSLALQCRPRSMPQGMSSNFINMSNLQFNSTAATVSDRGFIEESACDMLAYSSYSQNLETIAGNLDFAKLNNMPANHPQILQTMQFAANQETTWGSYFRQRGFDLRSQQMGPTGSLLFNDMSGLNSSYVNGYNAIVRQHSALLGGPNANGSISNSQTQSVNPNPPQFVNMDPRTRGNLPQNSARIGNGAIVNPQAGNIPWQQQSAAQRGAVTPVAPTQLRSQSMQMNGGMGGVVPQSVPMQRR